MQLITRNPHLKPAAHSAEKIILTSLFSLIIQLKDKDDETKNLILDDSQFDLMEKYYINNKINQELKLKDIKEIINSNSNHPNLETLNRFINLLEKRMEAYACANNAISARIQYNAFAQKLGECLTGIRPPSFDTYFSPRHYYTVTPPEVSNNTDSSAYYHEKSRKGIIAAKTFLGIGISFLILGAASVAFCPPLGIISIALGTLMIISAGIYLAESKMPNVENIQQEEREIFNLGQQLHAIDQPDNCLQDTRSSMPTPGIAYG